MLRDHRSHATGATQRRGHDGQVKQGEQEVLHARDSVGQMSGAMQRGLNPGFSERIGNSRRTAATVLDSLSKELELKGTLHVLRHGFKGGSSVARREGDDAEHDLDPDLAAITLPLPPDQVFDRALAAAQDAGWELVTADKGTGRIEATDTTRWFGFKDDVVVRLAPGESGTRVDVRSVSRVGGSDVGTNARRIREYLERLQAS